MAPVDDNPQSTPQDPVVINENGGYTTDQSQNPPHCRCSLRASSLVLVPNMVAPSSDSWVRLTRPTSTTRKQRAAAVPSSDSESSLQIESESDEESVQTGSAANVQKLKPKRKKPCQHNTPAQKKKTTPASKKKGAFKKTVSVPVVREKDSC